MLAVLPLTTVSPRASSVGVSKLVRSIVKQLQNVKNCVIASRDEITAWQSNELHSNSSTLISVVTDLYAIISGSLKLLTNLVVTTPAALVKKSTIFLLDYHAKLFGLARNDTQD
ncbi:MAG: hypothetical protein IKI11_03430 [Neisseriaceae bacterium]|nr:hypothetical protein [Neisseriaceae bacterium]